MCEKRGEDPQQKDWLIPTLPKFSAKKEKGPLEFIRLLW